MDHGFITDITELEISKFNHSIVVWELENYFPKSTWHVPPPRFINFTLHHHRIYFSTTANTIITIIISTPFFDVTGIIKAFESMVYQLNSEVGVATRAISMAVE